MKANCHYWFIGSGIQNHFQNGDLTIRQLAGMLKKNIDQTIALLNTLNIPIIDYDFNEDINTLKDL